MARGRMLREKHISAVKQSSPWTGFFSKLCLPQAARFSYPASPTASHKRLPHLLAKKNSPNWNSLISDNRASGGPAVSSFIYGLYAFIVTATRLEGSIESLPWSIHLFWNRWRCWKAIQLRMWFVYFALGLFGRWKRWHGQYHRRSQKDVSRCHEGDLGCYYMLTWTCLFILRTAPGDPAHCVIHFLLVSKYKTARYCFGCITFPCLWSCCPTFQRRRITWMLLVQSAYTHTVIGLNKKTQNRLWPVPSGPPPPRSSCVDMPETTALIQRWMPVMQSQHIPFVFTRERPANQGRIDKKKKKNRRYKRRIQTAG